MRAQLPDAAAAQSWALAESKAALAEGRARERWSAFLATEAFDSGGAWADQARAGLDQAGGAAGGAAVRVRALVRGGVPPELRRIIWPMLVSQVTAPVDTSMAALNEETFSLGGGKSVPE